MRIILVGPGIYPIPPIAWGAVETLIWDQYVSIKKTGHDVSIVNERLPERIIEAVNAAQADVVHLHSEAHIAIVERLRSRLIILTSHYGYILQKDRWSDNFKTTFNQIVANNRCHIGTLSKNIYNLYLDAKVPPDRLSTFVNGARADLISFRPVPTFPRRTIYLAKIQPRKRQVKFLDPILNLDFVGPLGRYQFPKELFSSYLGEWTKSHLYRHLSDYPNLALLSDGEAHPLVCAEAMTAGLGLVISKWASENIDTSWPFVDIIPEAKIGDINYIAYVLHENRLRSISNRIKIRSIAVSKFDYGVLANKYIERLSELLSSR